MVFLRFYRVQDDESRVRLNHRGFFAEDDCRMSFQWAHHRTSPYLRGRLTKALGNHEDWSCREPSPFISTYFDLDAARREARRRRDQYRTESAALSRSVKIYEIAFHPDDSWEAGLQFRKVPGLADMLGVDLSHVGNNADHEYIFLHHIPRCFIKRRLVRF